MKTRALLVFIAPSVVMMLVFIALPLTTVFWQSFHVSQPVFETVRVENCTTSFLSQVCTTEEKTRPVLGPDGKMQMRSSFVGLSSYANVLEMGKAFAALADRNWRALMAINFWKALRFTLTFTFLTLPIVLLLGVTLALAVDSAARSLRGSIIFVSLLPFIITPVIGALSIKWLFIGDGILTSLLETWLQRDVAVFAQSWSIELIMMFYRVWHVAPFAFLIFYASLQTVNRDTLESAIIDGASRWERVRYVVLPHLAPVLVFVTLIHLMDSYRVFEEIVGFSSQAHVISLQWLTYDFLKPDDSGNRSISRASASAMLTMIGVVVLLAPLLRRTWADFRGSRP
ncbi:MAG: sugar ABC transporter permease [Methylobacteriaceae bacterium]|nr:sugar ABC transporter permease [Methylobacteriaceae bacterium]